VWQFEAGKQVDRLQIASLALDLPRQVALLHAVSLDQESIAGAVSQ
jgi:hypothetical protein